MGAGAGKGQVMTGSLKPGQGHSRSGQRHYRYDLHCASWRASHCRSAARCVCMLIISNACNDVHACMGQQCMRTDIMCMHAVECRRCPGGTGGDSTLEKQSAG